MLILRRSPSKCPLHWSLPPLTASTPVDGLGPLEGPLLSGKQQFEEKKSQIDIK